MDRRTTALTFAALVPAALLFFLQPPAPQTVTTPTPTSRVSSVVKTGQKKAAAEKRVSREVEARNAEERNQRQRFIDEGWTFVDTAEPDERITGLDPEALIAHEREIQVQLQSNGYSGEMLDRVYALFTAARGEKTRFVALEALGRSLDARAQELLMKVFDESRDEGERAQALSSVRPQEFDDAGTRFLVRVLERGDVTEALKKQAASQLAGLSLVRTVPAGFAERLPGAYRNVFRQLRAQALAEGGSR